MRGCFCLICDRYKDGRVSSQGQQVTGYPFQDDNNIWVVEPVDPEIYKEAPAYEPNSKEKERGVRYLRDRDIVRLRHFMSDTYLVTHDVASPLTATHMEMTTLSVEKADNRYPETLWSIEIVDEDETDEDLLLETRRYDIRIRNVEHDVCVHTHKGVLPDWGFKQQEVNGNKKVEEGANSWTIDSAQHERIIDGCFLTRDFDSYDKERTRMNKRDPSLLDALCRLCKSLTNSKV